MSFDYIFYIMNKNLQEDKLIIIAGPTATGKTSLALKLAKDLDGELINADSRQVYKSMDIGTNKGAIEITDKNIHEANIHAYQLEGSGVIGWLFDLVDPDQNYTLVDYINDFWIVFDEVVSRGKQPILVGGTGLYIDAIIKGYNIDNQAIDRDLRASLESLGLQELQSQLSKLDADLMKNLNNSDRNNPRRLIRLIEKHKNNSDLESVQKVNRIVKRYKMIYPKFDRDQLYQKINKRVAQMIDQGLVQEVQKLLKLGYVHTKPLQGIGYKEVVKYLNGEYTKDEMTDKIRQHHRNYARRQITWFEGEARDYDLKKYGFENEYDLILDQVK